MKNVMVFSCGSIPGIDINFALRGNQEYKIYGASSYDDHGVYVYENYIGNVPFIFEEDFIPRFNQILAQYSIDFIIPLHEDMILYFQQHVNEINATVISSCYDTALLCRYKSKTYQALAGLDFVPRVYKCEEVDSFPVFVKKDDDQGARHAYKVDNQEELDLYGHQEKMIICEYLPGEEVTVDCFTDRHGQLRFINPRAADRILAGIDVHARRLVHDAEIESIAQRINERIAFRGPWFFQIKRDVHGSFKLLEIASRFAGAFALTLGMDMNTPLMAIRDFDGKDVSFSFNDTAIEADKMFISRYCTDMVYDRALFDGVECLLLNQRINTMMMMLVYQMHNEGKNVMLISDDVEVARQHLRSLKVDEQLFKLVDRTNAEPNLYERAVFISPDEEMRKSVRDRYGVCCYEPNLIGALLNWRA